MLGKLKISGKLAVLAGTLLAFTVVVSLVAIISNRLIERELSVVAHEHMPMTEKLTAITTHQLNQSLILADAFRAATQGDDALGPLIEFEDRATETAQEFQAFSVFLKNVIAKETGEAQEVFAKIETRFVRASAQFETYMTLSEEVSTALNGDDLAAASAAMVALSPVREDLSTELQGLLMYVEKLTEKALLTVEAHEHQVLLIIIGLGVAALFMGVGISFVIGRAIAKPVSGMVDVVKALADGDTSVEVPQVTSRDEVADLCKAVEVFRQQTIDNAEMRRQQEAHEAKQKERAKTLSQLTDAFQHQVGDVLGDLDGAVGDLTTASGTMVAVASQTSEQSSEVATASEQAAANVQTVASATEELSNSITEINAQVARSTEMAAQASKEAENADDLVTEMSEAAKSISDVIELINEITDRTNLLALNATIEASRAGEAGKGFAVVAHEVKALAQQTASATGQVTQSVAAVQAKTLATVDAIHGVAKTINSVSESASAIAAAVNEQGAATTEIARSVEEAASGTEQVSSTIREVHDASKTAGSAAGQVRNVSEMVAERTKLMSSTVETFLSDVKAA